MAHLKVRTAWPSATDKCTRSEAYLELGVKWSAMNAAYAVSFMVPAACSGASSSVPTAAAQISPAMSGNQIMSRTSAKPVCIGQSQRADAHTEPHLMCESHIPTAAWTPGGSCTFISTTIAPGAEESDCS
jgi:hypothetical protein